MIQFFEFYKLLLIAKDYFTRNELAELSSKIRETTTERYRHLVGNPPNPSAIVKFDKIKSETLLEAGSDGSPLRTLFTILIRFGKYYNIVDLNYSELSLLNLQFSERNKISDSCDSQHVTITLKPKLRQRSEVRHSFHRVPYSAPRNRLTRRFGAENFITVSLKLPYVHIEDIIAYGNLDKWLQRELTKEREVDDAQIFEDLYIQFQSALGDPTVNIDAYAEIAERERLHAYLAMVKYVPDLLKPVDIRGRLFHFLCCNTTGALENSFTFVRADLRERVVNWAFAQSAFNDEKVFKANQPTQLPIRLSLYNSISVPSISLDPDTVHYIESIDPTFDKHVDGCGMISETLAKEVYLGYKKNYPRVENVDPPTVMLQDLVNQAYQTFTQLETRNCDVDKHNDGQLSSYLPRPTKLPDDFIPSVFQIRYKGYKGTLVVMPDDFIKEKYGDFGVVLTRDMKKFDAPEDNDEYRQTLEIVGISSPSKAFLLTSELIILLEGLASNDDAIFNYLKRILIDRRGDIIIDNRPGPLRELFTGDLMKCIQLLEQRNDLQGISLIRREIEAQQSESSNEFIQRAVIMGTNTFHSYILGLNVPMPNSAHVYGVADFTGTLQQGEVFLSLQNESIEGDILVTRTPALYSSDMRKMKAVDVPGLRHLRNVLVFSVQGDIPAPKLLAGGDLDGDHYTVLYDPHLVGIINAKPAHDAEAQPKKSCGCGRASNASTSAAAPSTSTSTSTSTPIASTSTSISRPDLNSQFSKALEMLLRPTLGFEHCSFSHLIGIYRRFVDYYGSEWPKSDIVRELAAMINDTIDAPKHGDTKNHKWENHRELLSENGIPAFPHYHKYSHSGTTRQSTSLFGRLHNALVDEVLSALSSAESPQAQ